MNIFKITYNFIRLLFEKRYLIYELTKRDFQGKYIANVLGLAWAVLEPLAFMMILWLVFGVGLRGGRSMAIPYHVYLISGLCVYLFFAQTLSQATQGVKILSGLMLHFIVLGIVVVISFSKGLMPNIYWLQLPYYMICAFVLLLGLSWLASSVVLFVPDISNIIQILLRFLFYLSPIFWEIRIFPQKFHLLLKLNPFYYLITGYRDSLYFGIPFWHQWEMGLYYWATTFFFMLVGMITFKKLQPHFADVV
jgi:lipopolysaccharide transport system permease protein/teichoic acid transport system permease protein